MSRSGGRTPSQRQLRVGEEVRHGLARILGRGDFADPQLASMSITVTEVRVSPDLKQATVFVTPLGGEGLASAVGALNRAAGFIRGQLAGELVLKSIPRVVFKADQSFDAADRLRGVLNRPRVRQDIDAAAPDRATVRDDDEGQDQVDGA